MAAKTIEPGSPVKQFSVMLHNRAGALAALVKLLRNAAIEVVGLSMQDSRDATVARLVVTDPETAEHIFMEKGIPYTTCDLVVLSLKESGPELLPILDTLMVAETNIDFAYALMPSQQGHALLALHVEDYDFATSILGQSGFKLLKQEDLSR
ncbi:MAG: amino acid-binding [Akkermansiaceae bacterium]|nr:amino acid-binding [Akkermansiaceae bacterium]